MICTSLAGPTADDLCRQCRAAKSDLVEFRFDLYRGLEDLEIDRPVVFSRVKDKKWFALQPDYVDGDWAPPGSQLIRSYHNYDETPDDLEAILSNLKKKGGDLFKIATMATNSLDALRMIAFMRRHPEVIAFCMGEFGRPTRVLARWTYACQESTTAPGQLTAFELQDTYNYYAIGPNTKLYGLVGDPVDQSVGKVFHNREFKRRGIDGVYLPFRVRQGELNAFLKLAKELPFVGLSVTMPLKREFGEPINTIVFGETLKMVNTDGPGALDAIGDVFGKHVAIYGVGGTGQAIAEEAKKRGAKVELFHRKPPGDYDVLIQCTPVGMDGRSMPLGEESLIPGKVVMDVINEETPFLQLARDKGCRVVSGKEMYVNQAERQLELWGAAF